MSVRVSHRFAVALWLAIGAANGAQGADLYRWVTPEGRVEIGTAPPPGVHAEKWKPEPAAPPEPVAPSAAAPEYVPDTPAPYTGAVHDAAAEAKARCQEDQKRKAAELKDKRAAAEREVASLEARIAELDDSLVASESSTCFSDSVGTSGRPCTDGTFDRDAELERAQRRLDKAQSKLGDLEQKEQLGSPKDDCSTQPAAPAPAR